MGWFTSNEHDEERLSAYLDGELDAPRAEAVERHLVSCASCSSLLDELRETHTMLAALPRVAPRRSFVLGAEHARARATPPGRRWSALAFAPAVALSVFVALLVVDLGGVTSSSSSHDTLTTLGSKAAADTAQSAAGSAGSAPVPALAPEADRGSANSATGSGTPPANAGGNTSSEQPVPATPAGTLSTFSADQAPPPAPAPADASRVNNGEDSSRISTLRALEVLAALVFLTSAFLVFVRPRLLERR